MLLAGAVAVARNEFLDDSPGPSLCEVLGLGPIDERDGR
jgi:hypothetical protein